MFCAQGLTLLQIANTKTINIASKGDYVMHNAHSYGVNVMGVSWIHFRVKGCNDGYIRLYPTIPFKGEPNAYVVFGGWGNDKCMMTPCPGCNNINSQRFPYLNCHEYRPMWLNWTARTLSVGTGAYVGEGTFMTANQERDFDVKYLGVGSGWNNVFDWEFDGPPGEYFELKNPIGASNRPRLFSTTSRSIFECIQVCQQTRACKAVSYRKSDDTCVLTAELPREDDIEKDSTWQTWFEML